MITIFLSRGPGLHGITALSLQGRSHKNFICEEKNCCLKKLKCDEYGFGISDKFILSLYNNNKGFIINRRLNFPSSSLA